MRTAFPILAITLSACDAGGGTRFPHSPSSLHADVAGTLERVDPGGTGWLGVEVVDLSTSDGDCGLTREIAAVEAIDPCADCRLTLTEVATTVVDRFGECGVDLELDVPSVGSSLAFRANEDWTVPATGDVLVGASEGWDRYSSGLLDLDGLSYQHQARLGADGNDPDGRDLPDKPVIR
jgi:hypothetical protein